MPNIYKNIAVLQCTDESRLNELLAGGLSRFTVRTLGARSVQIDHERLIEVRRLLERLGQTPRIVRG
jgi:hypothetical protein